MKHVCSPLVYYLSLQRCNKFSEFSIHGLWPNYNSGGYPQFCAKTPFNLTTLLPILDELNENWNSCRGKSASFWHHEFSKHATCFDPPTTEFDYFNDALNVYHRLKNDGTICRTCHSKLDCMIELPNYNA